MLFLTVKHHAHSKALFGADLEKWRSYKMKVQGNI